MPRSLIQQSKAPQPAPYAPPIGIVAAPVPAIGSMPIEIARAIAAAPRDTRTSRIAGITLLVSAALLLFGLVSRAWFAAGSADVGLLGVDSTSWFDIAQASTALKLFSAIGIVGIVAAVAFLGQAALMLLEREPQCVMLRPLNASLGVAAFGCFSFFFRLAFGELSLSTSYAGITTLAAIIGASVVINALVRPLTKR